MATLGTSTVNENRMKLIGYLNTNYVKYSWSNTIGRARLLWLEVYDPWLWLRNASTFGMNSICRGLLPSACTCEGIMSSFNFHQYRCLDCLHGAIYRHTLSGCTASGTTTVTLVDTHTHIHTGLMEDVIGKSFPDRLMDKSFPWQTFGLILPLIDFWINHSLDRLMDNSFPNILMDKSFPDRRLDKSFPGRLMDTFFPDI